ncbi:NAD(P)-dependent oxidoreductase [Novosphingobium gossypii]|uniref:NAD(P)-dependent oxidoreductase n=1 Tax=Novosphingobium gossypii TaxID=1604774 RepID=UPI003D21C9FE
MTKMKVAVLGLGIMGSGMARRVLAAGHELTVWNRSRARAEPLGEAGARIADTPAQAAQDADVVVAMLADDAGSRMVWTGEDGALAAMRGGAVAVECSTLTSEWVGQLAQAATGRGIGFLDAPVTGSRRQANDGALRFMAGGDAAVLEQARPVFEAMGSEVIHLGPTGSGATLKLVNNFLCGVQVASIAEALVMLERSGLDVQRAFDLLCTGAPGSPILKMLGQRMLDGAFEPQFLVPLMAKDLSYAEAEFARQGITLESAAAARARFDAAAKAGFADRDMSAVVEAVRS